MRETIAKDGNNVDRIGSANNPGLRVGMLTRAQHRDRLASEYKGREPHLEELLDSLHGAEPRNAEGPQ